MSETSQLILKKPEMNDLNRFFQINSNPENNMFNPLGPVKDVDTAKDRLQKIVDHWSKYDFGIWKIIQKESCETIGFGGISYKEYGMEVKLNLGYRIDRMYWNRGYITELAEFSVIYAFSVIQKNEVFALVRPGHPASIRVLEKCGMTKAGLLDDVPGEEKSLVYRVRKTSQARAVKV